MFMSHKPRNREPDAARTGGFDRNQEDAMTESGPEKAERPHHLSPKPQGALPRHLELEYRVGWLIKLRWLAIVGIAVTPDAVRIVAGVQVNRFAVWAVAAFMVLVNLTCAWCRKARLTSADPQTRLTWARGLAVFQSAADLLALTLLLHVSGGIQNPFATYYIFHVIISAILLSKRSCWAVTAAGAFLIVVEILLHDMGIWPRTIPAGWETIFGPAWGLKADLAVGFVLVSTMAVAAALATSMMEELRRRTQKLLELQRDLEARNESLARAYDKLQTFSKMKDRFLGIATHDIKAPLAEVEGYMRALSDGTVDPCSDRGKQWIERSRIRLEGMRRLVTDLLDISRIESGHVMSEKTQVDILALAKEAYETFRVQAEEANLTLTMKAPDTLSTVCGSEDRLRQIIENLLSNAIKFTDEGGVTLAVSEEETERDGVKKREIVLAISDTGMGIPEEDLAHIFDDFYRVRGGKKREGVGLGLAIVHRLVEAHGGTITAESTVGKGTTFTVRLPVTEACQGALDMMKAIKGDGFNDSED